MGILFGVVGYMEVNGVEFILCFWFLVCDGVGEVMFVYV